MAPCPNTISGAHYFVILRTVRQGGITFNFGECGCCSQPHAEVIRPQTPQERG